MLDAKEELYNRLRRHSLEVSTVSISWNASDGGPQMSVQLKGVQGKILSSWTDSMILGTIGGPTGCDIIIGIVRNVLGSRARLTERGNFSLTFMVV